MPPEWKFHHEKVFYQNRHFSHAGCHGSRCAGGVPEKSVIPPTAYCSAVANTRRRICTASRRIRSSRGSPDTRGRSRTSSSFSAMTWGDATQFLLDTGVPVNALTVVNDHSVRFPDEIYEHHKDLGLTHMQFIPCLETVPGDQVNIAPFSVFAEVYGAFLCTLSDRCSAYRCRAYPPGSRTPPERGRRSAAHPCRIGGKGGSEPTLSLRERPQVQEVLRRVSSRLREAEKTPSVSSRV